MNWVSRRTSNNGTGGWCVFPTAISFRTPYSPDNQLMSPFSDLSDVAAAGRRVGAMRGRLLRAVLLKDVRGIKDYAEEEFRKYISQGGTFDYQRRKYQFGKDGLT